MFKNSKSWHSTEPALETLLFSVVICSYAVKPRLCLHTSDEQRECVSDNRLPYMNLLLLQRRSSSISILGIPILTRINLIHDHRVSEAHLRHFGFGSIYLGGLPLVHFQVSVYRPFTPRYAVQWDDGFLLTWLAPYFNLGRMRLGFCRISRLALRVTCRPHVFPPSVGYFSFYSNLEPFIFRRPSLFVVSMRTWGWSRCFITSTTNVWGIAVVWLTSFFLPRRFEPSAPIKGITIITGRLGTMVPAVI